MKDIVIGSALLVGFAGLVYGFTAIDHYIHTQLGFGWALVVGFALAIPTGIKTFCSS